MKAVNRWLHTTNQRIATGAADAEAVNQQGEFVAYLNFEN